MKSRMNWPLAAFAAAAAAATVLAGMRLAVAPPAHDQPMPARLPPSPDDAALMERLEAKAGVARDVAEGRLSVREGAAVFRGLDACGPPPLLPVRDAFPAAHSEEEAYCRSVIAWAAAASPPGKSADLTRRLEAELGVLVRDGPVRLVPRPPTAPTQQGWPGRSRGLN